ncbi:CDP-alcohol phosphatidyltransferase family protein [Luteipulveratus flavus]|uniref:CDP-alcohol phosphatidyltransferase family protein n=1 Tax=Luteipulveratus flavus TaxID=3031728 RepID=A0ABT6CB61_9MICO|nr:CDP-alcohol phosphatidyltransferase family protein [Luteipulveratus sp. YIM 133296]MDF8266134.1 CDP-alcohol phosphatidyltransferase family protein [Luteipulveratus sp. YIM 133296]
MSAHHAPYAPRQGLYALKPWYAARLTSVLALLVRRHVHPNRVSAAGVVMGAGAGVALATLPTGAAALAVAPLLALRLAAANLDGNLARVTGRRSRWGSVVNELGDRAAELAALVGCFWLAPAWLVLAAMLAATLPSWVALAGAAAGHDRLNGGPVGKTERCLALVGVAAVPGAAVPLLAVVAAGSAVTAVRRAIALRSL